jgi:hypothetical protein
MQRADMRWADMQWADMQCADMQWADFWVEVRHRHRQPKRYTWEIHRKGVCLSVEESLGQFGSWEEASQVGNKVLKQFLQAR